MYLLWTFGTYRDYGMTFDESGVYARGIALARYLVHDDFPGFLFKNAPDDGLVMYDHLYPMALSILNPWNNLDYYHWLNLVFGLLAFAAAFELLLAEYGKPWPALLGPVFLFLTPRFLGHVPANPKDMPFAVFYFLALAGIYYFNRHPRVSPAAKALVLGLLFGLAQCTRLLGLTLYGVYLMLDLHFYHHEGPRRTVRDWARHLFSEGCTLFLVFAVSSLLMTATWPYLGANYLDHLRGLLASARHFHWDNNVLFFGRETPSDRLPRTYLPLWLLVTTPLFILFFSGAAFLSVKAGFRNRLWVLLASAFGLNVLLFLVLHPVLYDGVRHFLFLLPILSTLAALAAVEFLRAFKPTRLRTAAAALCVLNAGMVAGQMVRLHPYEYIYFNELIGGLKGSQGRLDNDYWGASFKEAVDWLKANEIKDPEKTYAITGSGNPYQIFCYFSRNMKWTDSLKDADYYVSYTRDNKEKLAGPAPVVHVVEREGVPLNYVFRLKGN